MWIRRAFLNELEGVKSERREKAKKMFKEWKA